MVSPAKVNYKLYQGSTFNEVLRWESANVVFKNITGITATAPVVITSAAHGLPAGWRFKVTNVSGMKDINSTDTYRIATAVDTNTITIGDLNGAGFAAYTTGGIIEYNDPVNLTGYTARLQLRANITDTTFIDEYTTENGKLVIDTVNKTITISVDATTTSAYTFSTAVYSLEVIKGATVTQLSVGTITLVKEITR